MGEEINLEEKYKTDGNWGLSSSIDLHNCDPDLIRDEDKIKEFVVKLCELIDMKRFGECKVINFGEDEEVAGFSMMQLIETSLISAHFANKTNRVFLDIFSCKYYSPKETAEFAKDFFDAKDYKFNYILRN